MKISDNTHLCYSLNVFPRSDSGYLKNIETISENFCEIRKNLGYSQDTLFGLGLWLDADAVEELEDPSKLTELKNILQGNNFYVFTINAFPYGKFHGGPIKDKVYIPNWTDDQRKEFTIKVADIIASLLPEGVDGSISTLPGGYKEHFERRTSNVEHRISNYEELIAGNLTDVADHLAEIEEEKGKRILLGIEMEPDCIWESPAEYCEFRKKFLSTDNAEKFIGVCYDTCHQELLGNRPGDGLKYLLSQNIPIAKIQLSAALKTEITGEKVFKELANFSDPVYLHQTRIFDMDKKITDSFSDITEVEESRGDQLVTHFHMPLYAEKVSDNFNVAKDELEAVLEILRNNPSVCSHLEIETYTYKVLPSGIKAETTEQMIIDEYKWILNQMT